MRNSKPEAGNKYFNTKSNGGYSTCIVGKPTDKGCNVLANCVGYANGAFNENIGKGKEIYNLTCNAENFVERAISLGLSVVKEPVLGGVMVWQKGATLSSKDGAGHVAFVYEIVDKDTIKTGESGYNSKAYWNTKRSRGNGNWGQASSYTYRGCIVPPNYVEPEEPEEPKEEPTITYKFKVGDKVIINGSLYKSSNASKASGKVTNKVTEITRLAKGAKHPYNTTGDLGWMNENDIKLYVEETTTGLKVGDAVKIIGTGKAASNGSGVTAGGIGWTRHIIGIKEGAAYPYRVGEGSATTGWYKEEALQKI